MPRCSGFKPDGCPCERIVGASQRYCFSHDPDRADERRRSASRAAKSKQNPLLRELHGLLENLTTRVVEGNLETPRGAVANQLIMTRIKLIELERRVKEIDQLEKRLAEMETRAEQRWGA